MDEHEWKRRRSPHDLVSLVGPARYVAIPKPFLTKKYVRQVGPAGMALITCLCLAYDEGRRSHRLRDGWLALPDSDLAEWLGHKTTEPIRRVRTKVLKAKPAFLKDYRPGSTGCPSEYQIRRLSEDDRVLDFPKCCVGLSTRRRHAPEDFGEMMEIALDYAAGDRIVAPRSVIPIKRNKVSYVKWKEYQERRPSDEEIRGWFTRWPEANIAVVTGAVSDLVVVDIDGDHDEGIALMRQHGIELPPTRIVRTGTGGAHLHFRYPGVLTPSLSHVLENGAVQIDVRGDGGCAVMPPSIHENGNRYRFVDDNLRRARPVLPESFVRLLQAQQPRNWGADSANPTDIGMVKMALSRMHIVAVMQSYGVVLREDAEDRHVGLCPFHLDTSPSLVVTPSKGLFQCFGCKSKGNTASFVMKKKGCAFEEALRAIRRVAE